MPPKGYGLLEQHIINVINRDKEFVYNSTKYSVQFACKPRPSSGECKTDIYILANSQLNGNILELKISVKSRDTNEFQENKVCAEKAEAYFGLSWENIISTAAKSICDTFEDRPLIYISGKYPTKPNSITLGWKLDIANKPRELSVKAPLSDDEIRNFVYKGTNQNADKRNARVSGTPVENAGVADYLLVTDVTSIKSANDVISQMILIDDVILNDTYLIFTANNYRTEVDSTDGPRSLAVYIQWECIDNKLCHAIHYDAPLAYTGKTNIKLYIKKCFAEIRQDASKRLQYI